MRHRLKGLSIEFFINFTQSVYEASADQHLDQSIEERKPINPHKANIMKSPVLTLLLLSYTAITLYSQSYQVSGQVTNACGDPIANLQVRAQTDTGNVLESAVTDSDGNYTVSTVIGESVSIAPVSPNDYLNGVSTFDMVLMERHILNIEAFNSPYQHIAADVNLSETITSLDRVLVEKLILQEDETFENSPSWRYIANAESLTLSTAFEATFQHSYGDLIGDVSGADFTAVKMGDVNQLGCSATVTSVAEEANLNEFTLTPNPFVESTNLTFWLGSESTVEVLVTDIVGRELIRSQAIYPAGKHQYSLDGQTFMQRGVYLISLSDGRSQMSKRVIYSK